jgi:hypothetical protein
VDLRAVTDALLEARIFLARADSDYSWSSWEDTADAVAEIDALLAQLRDGVVPAGQLAVVFGPTGPMQEVSLSSGWGDDFTSLADRVGTGLAPGPAAAAEFHCRECGASAGSVDVLVSEGPPELQRTCFTSVLTQPIAGGQFRALHALVANADATGLFAADPEYAPFFCPDCTACYCGVHWARSDEFDDDGWHDSIRGRCPAGHERMLED